MNKTLKLILPFIISLGIISFVCIPVFAQNGGSAGLSNTGQIFQIPNPTKYNSLEDIINALTSLIRPIFILTFAGMILYGAWIRLTSQGDAGKIEQSTKIIVAAIVGFSIAVFAPSIVDFIGKLIGVKGGLITT